MNILQMIPDLEELVQIVKVVPEPEEGDHTTIRGSTENLASKWWNSLPDGEKRISSPEVFAERADSFCSSFSYFVAQLNLQRQFSVPWQEKLSMSIKDQSKDLEIKFSQLGDLPQILVSSSLRDICQTLSDRGISASTMASAQNMMIELILGKIAGQDFLRYCAAREIKPNPHKLGSNGYIRARRVREKYDFGVCLANGGSYAGYYLHLAGLPVMDVEMKRRGAGATWKPKQNFDGTLLEGKKVLIIENDVVTGQTLRRATQEIQQYHPGELAVCFMEGERLCKTRNIPKSILQTYHLIDGSDVPLQEMYQYNMELARQFDAEYDIFKK